MRSSRRQDDGVTLVEVAVSVSLMSVVTLLFVTGVVQIHGSVRSTESMATSQSQINIAFQRLEREVRYASAIKVATGRPRSMALLTANTGAQICTQLWLTGGLLKRRTWSETANSSVAVALTGWTTVASQVHSTQPFELLAPDEARGFQRLRVRLTSTGDGGSTAKSRVTDVTFTALNSTRETDSSKVCTHAGPL